MPATDRRSQLGEKMKDILEQKLRELIRESERQGAPAMHVVLNLLLASHLNGSHHEFARHATQFNRPGFDGIELTSPPEVTPGDDFDSEYIH